MPQPHLNPPSPRRSPRGRSGFPSNPSLTGILVGLLAYAPVQGAQGAAPTNAMVQPGAPAPSAGSVSNPPATAVSVAAPAPEPAKPDPVSLLLERLERLERQQQAQESARESARKAEHEAVVQQLQSRIADLEQKVRSLEGARILPEIALPAEDAPTNAELDQKLRVLERREELAQEAAEERARSTPQLSVGSSGFVLRSADTNFVLRLRGLVQTDTRTFFGDHPLSEGNDGFFLRRARLGVEGTLWGDFDYQLVTEFAGPNNVQVLDANVAYRYRPELRFRIGKFKSPVGHEQLLSVHHLFFNERSPVTGLVPVRNPGAQVEGESLAGRLSWAAGVYSPSGDGDNGGFGEHGDDLEFGGRLAVQPFKRSGNAWLENLAIGVGGTFTQVSSNLAGLPNNVGGTRPGYTTSAGQQLFAYNSPSGLTVADGPHWRVSPHLTYLKGPFGLLGEYILTRQGVLNATTLRTAELDHSAWQIAAQWVLTGEDATFQYLNPSRPFRPQDGNWGAWQLVGRFGQFDLDPDTFPAFANPATSARSATTWSVGINWWLNRNLRVLTSFSRTTFDGGGQINPVDPATLVSPATVTHQPENALLTRLQLAF